MPADFQTAHKITDVPMVGDYYDDFSDYPLDVNGDGWIDIVTGGYFSESAALSREPARPVASGPFTMWTRRAPSSVASTTTSTAMASTRCSDHRSASGLQAGSGGRWLHEAHAGDRGWGGHGITGFGDLNGDGYADAVFNGGWMEGPEDPFSGEWVWHPEFDLGGSASVPILVCDVNEDGLSDLIVGGAHNYALDWWEQGMENGQRTWTRHSIDPHRSQYHDLVLADIDNDGELEMITGKRYRAHSGNDPGADDPVGLYYFEINGGEFQRCTLDYGPAGEASGAGIYLWVEDVDGNGWLDIVAPGKDGLYLFKNMGPQ